MHLKLQTTYNQQTNKYTKILFLAPKYFLAPKKNVKKSANTKIQTTKTTKNNAFFLAPKIFLAPKKMESNSRKIESNYKKIEFDFSKLESNYNFIESNSKKINSFARDHYFEYPLIN